MPELTGTTAQWVAAIASSGVLATVLGVLVRAYLGKGRLSIDAEQVNVTAEGALRDHYGKELQSLRNQINEMGKHQLEREREIDDRWRQTLDDSEKRHDECIRQRDALGEKVMVLEQKLIGTIRQFVHFQQRIAHAIANSDSTANLEAALQPFLETPDMLEDME